MRLGSVTSRPLVRQLLAAVASLRRLTGQPVRCSGLAIGFCQIPGTILPSGTRSPRGWGSQVRTVGSAVDVAGFRAAGWRRQGHVCGGGGRAVRLAPMRMIGPVSSYRGFGLQDHLCWVHGGPWDYRPRLTEFFGEGLERGLRVAYLGSGNAAELRDHLGGCVGAGSRLTQDSVRFISLDEIYGAGAPVDPAQVMKKYAAATEEALADGFRGLRVSADVTDFVRTPEQQDAFARCEFLLERYASRHPLSAMCEYRFELGDAVAQFACLHAAVRTGLTPVQVFACGDGAVGLLGEFDVASQTAFERALQRIQPAPGDAGLIFDMSAVRYMDHRALLALDSFAEGSRVPVYARHMPPIVRRVAAVLGLKHLDQVRPGGL